MYILNRYEVNMADAELQYKVIENKSYLLLPLLENYTGICGIVRFVDSQAHLRYFLNQFAISCSLTSLCLGFPLRERSWFSPGKRTILTSFFCILRA